MFVGGVHIDHAVLEHLEAANRHAELLALTRIFNRHRVGDLHRSAGLGAQRGDGFIRHQLDQRQPCALFPDQGIGRDRHLFEIDFRRAAAIKGFVIAGDDAGGGFVDHEHRHASAVAPFAAGARGDDQMARPRRADHHGLVPIEHIAAAVLLGGGFQIGIVISPARFGIGKGEHPAARHDPADMFFLLCRRARVLQKAARAHHGGQERFNHQPLAEFLHDDHRINRAAAKAAIGFAERHPKNAEFSQLRPDFRAPAIIAGDRFAPRFPIILFAHQPRQPIAHHFLFFGEIEIHVNSPVTQALKGRGSFC